MNPVFKILDTVFGSIGGLLNNISPGVQKTIRSAFFTLIFIIAMVGIYIGYTKGKSAASIKSDPLAKYTNQVFDIDIKRERDDGKFGDMLETESINEMKISDPNKIKYSTKDRFDPDFDAGIVEAGRDKKVWARPEMENKNMIFEDNPDKLKKDDAVRGITKRGNPFDLNNEEIMDKSQSKIMPDNPSAIESNIKTDSETGSIKKEKRKLIRSKDAGPETYKQGIGFNKELNIMIFQNKKTYASILFILFSIINISAKDFKQTEDIINSILNEPQKKYKQNQETQKDKNIIPEKSEKDDKDSGDKDAPNTSKADEVYYKTGIQFFNSEQYAQSMKNFEELKSKYPKSQYLDSSKIWIGKIKIKDYKYDDAIREFSGINIDSGEYPAALYLTGESYQYKRDYLTSLEYFEKVSSQFPQHDLADKAILKMVKLYMDNNNGTQALYSAVKLIKYYPTKDTIDDAYYLLGKIYEKDQSLLDIETARKFYRLFLKKAAAGDPLFAKSPLLKRVESDLKRLERDYFKLEK